MRPLTLSASPRPLRHSRRHFLRRGDRRAEIRRCTGFPLRSRPRPDPRFAAPDQQLSSDYGMIVIDIRLPRILLAIVVGASLSVAGTSFQALLRNPLADPYVLGVSSGAALGAILALIAEPHLALPACARRPVYAARRISRRRRHHRRSLFSWPPRGPDRQRHAAPRWHHQRFLSFRHHHVSA